jgi:hypothetical protein
VDAAIGVWVVEGLDMSVVAAVKRYVSDDRYRLRLFDTVADDVLRVLECLRDERFSVTAGWSDEGFRKRIPAFDEQFTELCRVEALLGYWGGASASPALTLPIRRMCDRIESGSGNSGWLELQWYPVLLLFYAGGVAAVAAGRFAALKELMHAVVRFSGKGERLVVAVTEGLNNRTAAFRLLPGLERHHVPCSDHVYEILQPLLDEMLFLGSEYEWAYDRFEVLYALEYAYQTDRGWGPIGRFGWKFRSESNPLLQTKKEAESAGASWPPLAAGLFGGSIDRLKKVTQAFTEHLARNPMW